MGKVTTRADDLRAKARLLESFRCCAEAQELRQHADTIERVEQEMCEWRWTADRTPSRVMGAWAKTLRGEPS